MGKIKKVLENELIGGTKGVEIYPITSVRAIYDDKNERLDHILSINSVINISTNYNINHTVEILTLSQAIAKVPLKERVLGFQGRYLSSEGWIGILYIGNTLSTWETESEWISINFSLLENLKTNTIFAGFAEPSTEPKNDANIFYLATTKGIYSNFNNFVLETPGLAILQKDNNIWKGKVIYKVLQELGTSDNFSISQNLITQYIKAIISDTVLTVPKNLFNKSTVEDGWLNGGTGNIIANTTSQYYVSSDYISVDGNQSYIFSTNGDNSVVKIRRVCFYDVNKKFLSSLENITSITTPSNTSYLRFTPITEIDKLQLEKGTNATNYEEYSEERTYKIGTSKILDHSITWDKLGEDVQAKFQVEPQYKLGGTLIRKASFINGEELILNSNSVKTFKTISFTASLTSFLGSLTIGHGDKTNYLGSWLEIDNNTIKTYYSTLGTDFNEKIINHTIDFSDKKKLYITITKKDSSSIATLTLATEADSFTTNIKWFGDSGNIYVKSNLVNLKNCTFSWTCSKLNSNCWIFGDSYLSLGDNKRWIYYLLDAGYNNILINAYPGQSISSNLTDFKELLKMGTPKIVIWAGGMNNKDDKDSDKINPTWLSSTQEFLKICKENNITPVLCTIPTVYGGKTAADDSNISGFRYHGAKNKWIKDNNYNYIDFALAVGANNNTGLWFGEGTEFKMLEGEQDTDVRVHPTAVGALILFRQAITDCPILIENNSYQFDIDDNPLTK